MKKVYIIGLALLLGAGLSSCDDDDDVRPMSVVPAGNFGNNDGTGTDGNGTDGAGNPDVITDTEIIAETDGDLNEPADNSWSEPR